jgi:hypothetical protein
MIKAKVLVIFSLVLFSFLIFVPSSVKAFSLDDLVKSVQQFFNPASKTPPPVLTVDSSITLTEDLNKNGQIDAGDTVKFSYFISNTTNTEYKLATLKTNLDRTKINFIHNLNGGSGMQDDGQTINFPNLNIAASQQLNVSFEASVNFDPSSDQIVATQPELVTADNQSIKGSDKKEVTVKKNSSNEAPFTIRVSSSGKVK